MQAPSHYTILLLYSSQLVSTMPFVAIPANSAGDIRGVTGLCVNKLASLQQAGAAAQK